MTDLTLTSSALRFVSPRNDDPSVGTLYVSFDGVLQPLGYSQIVRVIMELSRGGRRYELLSLERRKNLADFSRVRDTESLLMDAGIRWHRLEYEESYGAMGAGINLAQAGLELARRITSGGVRLVHARGYHAALVGMLAKATMNVPSIFDARGCWIDERLDEGRWFTDERVLSVARKVENQLYRNAAAVVTLTDLHAQEVRRLRRSAGVGSEPVTTIPTCADYSEFKLSSRSSADRPLTLGLVGSVNRSYHTREAVRLCRFVMEQDCQARLLAITQQPSELRAVLRAEEISASRVEIRTVSATEMPAQLHEIDWGIMLLSESRAKLGSMPTKLAEFFAAGVRPVHYGCNAEVSQWVRRAGSGYVLESISDADLKRAAAFVASSGPSKAGLIARARQTTEPHFSLEHGVARYMRLLDMLE